MRNRLRVASAAALILMFPILGGCSNGSTSDPDETTTTTVAATPSEELPRSLSPIDITTIDVHDPDAVAEAAIAAMYTYLPRVDLNQNAAMLRAAPLLNEKMAAGAYNYDPPTGPGRTWDRWADSNTLVSAQAKVIPQQRPPDDTFALRYVTVQQTTRTQYSTQKLAPLYLVVSLENTPDGWRVAQTLQR
uniref:hypothetical protein n=1 Tax=Rhodococcus qingshengii TaxID=334542 RepID=UPI001C4E2222|nr:hypothetical protein [Rhodococcus qingshengii]